MCIRQIGVGYREETLHAPACAPGIHDDEALRGIVIPHCQDSVPPQDLFAGSRHGDDASLGDLECQGHQE